MNPNLADVGWTEAQWNLVQRTLTDEVQKVRLAASFLPVVGPLDPTTVAVPNLTMSLAGAPQLVPGAQLPPVRLNVNSDPDLQLTTISTLVHLRGNEAADPSLAAALDIFRRSANLIARAEDTLLFHGRPPTLPGASPQLASLVSIGGTGANQGILPVLPRRGLLGLGGRQSLRIPAPSQAVGRGERLLPVVTDAILQLEQVGHFGPFACVLSHSLFREALTPSGAGLVTPRDRILPLIDGQLYRSSVIPDGYGVMISLGGAPLEIVMAADISARFLQLTIEPRFVFRVAERIVLRLKQPDAIVVMEEDGAEAELVAARDRPVPPPVLLNDPAV